MIINRAADPAVSPVPPRPAFEPLSLADQADLAEFAKGLAYYQAGRWHEDRWRTFRLRFGIYEQRQPGRFMVRAKIPGGRLSFRQAHAIAGASRDHTGGDIHATTRQDVQFYNVRLDDLPDLLGALHQGGVTTREASGSTFRNVTACPLAGICPNERVDAAEVAERLSGTWLRHSLVQHMPRKVKTSVSGCERDCGLTRIDDLGFIATRLGGRNGFRVVAGGGLGAQPHNAVQVFDFVTEEDLPLVQEALARLHHRHSNRANRNRSRIKFLVDKFGAEGFAGKLREMFAEVGALGCPDGTPSSWRPLAWRTGPLGDEAPGQIDAARLRGNIEQKDGRFAVVVEVPLGWLGSSSLDALTDLAERAGASGFVLTRDQNILARDLPADAVAGLQADVAALGFHAGGEARALGDVAACPGTSTCPIGITASKLLAKDLLASGGDFAGLPDVRVRVSGCQNSCGHHHIADIGLQGVAKKIDGGHAPHYRLHIGGRDPAGPVTGPVIPAHQAKPALKALLAALAEGRRDGESVFTWASRIGPDGIREILAFLPAPSAGDGIAWHTDVGEQDPFMPPATAAGECGAAAVVAEFLDDLAVVALQDMRRAMAAGDTGTAVKAGRRALTLPARRLLTVTGAEAAPGEELAAVRDGWDHDAELLAALDRAVTATEAFASDGDGPAVAALGAWRDAANRVIEDILDGVAGYLARAAAE